MTTPETVPYGATVDGVRALLPHRTIDATSKPSEAAVGRFLLDVARRTEARLGASSTWAGGTLTAEETAAYEAAARGLVELGAAAYTDDASFPERAATVGTSRYGAVLWERYKEGLVELAEVLAPGDDGGGPTVNLSGRPAFRLPAPLFTRSMGW